MLGGGYKYLAHSHNNLEKSIPDYQIFFSAYTSKRGMYA